MRKYKLKYRNLLCFMTYLAFIPNAHIFYKLLLIDFNWFEMKKRTPNCQQI